MSLSAKIGRNIVGFRKQKRLTQEWLALEADMAVSYLRAIEHGKANPTIGALERLAAILDVPLHLLLDTDENPSKTEAESYRAPMPVTEVLFVHPHYHCSVCPRCRITLAREYQAYCDRCGQYLDWADLSKAKLIYNL
ncbi:MAG: helix-turn-helix transcriptional regulator [Clostridia bacterium]|nr:helix-turn-helix transcriptional regulator [Clostridia bacterium]